MLAAIIPLREDCLRPSRRCRASPAGQWDRGYAGRLFGWAKDQTHVSRKIVRRMPWMKSFVVIRRRWVVERSFAWIMKCQRLARDYEQLPCAAETLVVIAAAATLVRQCP
jgi:transposase